MPVIDERMLEQLLELIGGDKDSLHELIDTFLEEGKEIVEQMAGALETADLDVLRRSAHSLKSSAQDFGAVELSKLNAALESQCKQGWPDNAAVQSSKITNHFMLADEALKRYLGRKSIRT